MATIPRPLQKGDAIRIVAPSGVFNRELFEQGVQIIREAGFEPRFESGVFSSHRYFAGSDERRVEELRDALADDGARAIWTARGGYGAARLLTAIEPAAVASSPKWLIGFSDATALHALWSRADVASLHGANVTTLGSWSDDARDELFNVLRGREPHLLDGRVARGSGAVSGPLLGGNLAVLASLAGTGFLPSFAESIVLLEDVGERPYRLDRTLTQLRLCGAFAGVRGFVVGQLTGCDEPPERAASFSAQDVVVDELIALGAPVLTGLSIGHEPSSRCARLGTRVDLDLDRGELRWLD